MEKPTARQSRVSILRRFWDMSESGIIIILIVYAIFVQCQ
jgi:hypothetical protein